MRHTTTVAAMPRASLSMISRCVTTRMGIPRPNLVKTTERLVETNSKGVKLDGAVFLNLTLGEATTSQPVYVALQVTGLFLSPEGRKELGATPLDVSAQTGQVV